jgi:hypothetical protein
MATGYYVVTQKYYKIHYEYGKLWKIFIGVLIISVIYYILIWGGYINILNKFILAILFLVYIFISVFEKNEMNFVKSKLLRR